MAVYREERRCSICGEKIREIHKSNNGDFIGDTFLGYEEHKYRESKLKLIKLAEEQGITGLVKALKDPKVNDSTYDLQKYGWGVLFVTSPPDSGEEVIVTDGQKMWFATFTYDKWQEYDKENHLAWTYKPDLTDLQEYLKNVQTTELRITN